MSEPVRTFDADVALGQWLALCGQLPEGFPAPESAQALIGDARGNHRQLLAAARDEVRACAARDSRLPTVLRDRIVGRRILDRIGTDLGLTRERVRQLEAGLREELVGGEFTALVIDGLGHRIEPFLHVSEVIDFAPGFLDEIPGLGVNLFSVVEAVAPWYITECGWLVAAGVDDRVGAHLGELADGAGLVDVAALAERIGVGESAMSDYLVTFRHLFVHRGHAFTRDKSIGDRAVGVLALADGPMTTAQLSELIPGRTRPSIRNALAATDRIRRCSPDTWTLVGRDGEGPVNAALPEYTAGMHRVGRRWSIVVDVDADIADGASLTIPHAAAALVKAPFNAPRSLSSRGSAQAVRWRRQGVSTSGISHHVNELGVVPGDRVRIIFRDGVEVAPVPPTHSDGPWSAVFDSMGLGEPPECPGLALAIVAEAVGLPPDASHCTVAARLRLRGEEFIAENMGDALAQAYTLEP